MKCLAEDTSVAEYGQREMEAFRLSFLAPGTSIRSKLEAHAITEGFLLLQSTFGQGGGGGGVGVGVGRGFVP